MRTCPNCQRTFSDDTDFCPRDGTPLPVGVTATVAQLTTGLSRRFRIVRELGAGGMGAVFLAEQIQLGNRPVALKVLLRKLLDDPEFLLRFQNEAASTARIHHPNVVTIYESGQTDDGTPYIAMEYLEGETLRKTIQRRGALPVAECAEILQQVARGLGAAHRLSIIHRDLKPDNIFLTRSEEGELAVKVVDFGIAKLRESATHTVTGMVLGTPQYMSFEQASGMRSDTLDARSDLYSLGIIAYEMLTGRLPFVSDTPLGYLRSHLTRSPLPFRTVNPDLAGSGQIENVVMKALSKERDQRCGSVMEFAQEFAKGAQAIKEAAGAALPTTRRVVPLPAGGAEPASSGKSGGGSVGSAILTPPPSSQRVEPADKSTQTRQQAPPVGSPQPASTPLPQFAMFTRQKRKAKYWMVGLVAVTVIAAVGIWDFYRSGPQLPKSPPTVGGEPASVSAEPPAHMAATEDSAAHVDTGNRLAGKRDWDGAITEYREALRADPKNANAHYNFGWALEQMGNLQEASQEYREAYEISPQNPVFHTAYERLMKQAKSQSEPAPEPAGPSAPQAPTPVAQALVNGNFVVRPLRYGTVQFSVPGGATQVKVKGFFRASGGTGNDIQVVIASPMDFQNWINGIQAQVAYATGKTTGGAINIENLPPGDYVLAFSNKFSALSRKQVTAVVTLSYIP